MLGWGGGVGGGDYIADAMRSVSGGNEVCQGGGTLGARVHCDLYSSLAGLHDSGLHGLHCVAACLCNRNAVLPVKP